METSPAFGTLVEMVTMSPCHGEGHGFESRHRGKHKGTYPAAGILMYGLPVFYLSKINNQINMHYSEKPGMVKVVEFKKSGKYYQTLQVDMDPYYSTSSPVEALRLALGSSKRDGMVYFCDEPYHQYAYPVCLLD